MIAGDAIVLDIEGTTTPISYVHDTLFGFAKSHLGEFLVRRGDEPAIANIVDDLRAEYAGDPDRPPGVSNLDGYVRWLIDRDRKSTALKALQGEIWRTGYESGELKSIVYDDVPPALAAWHAAGISIAIYSSGSIAAQQLLFRYTSHGDLTPSIGRYFDTTTGPKRAAASYAKIVAALAVPAARIVFVSDVVEELAASREAGMTCVLSIRPGNAPQPSHSFPTITSLEEVQDR